MTEEELIIRRATREDAEAVAKFCILGAQETTNKTLNEREVKAGVDHILRDHADFFVIAKIGQEYVGQLKVHRHYYDWYDETFWWIEHVYVHPEYRRAGISQKLLSHVAKLSRQHGYVKGLLLFVDNTNERAIASYNKFGFEQPELKLMVDYLTEEGPELSPRPRN